MNKHLLITGATSGIGAAIAELACTRGYALTLMARQSSQKEAEETAVRMSEMGAQIRVAIADVTDETAVINAFDYATKELGAPSALVNSAGISCNMPVRDLDMRTVQNVMDINVNGLMLCCREAARRMSTELDGLGGSIVNISSMAATIGGRPGASVYAASKAAVDCFTTGFAREVADEGIRVNSIRPGVIATRMTEGMQSDPELKRQIEASIPMGRMGRPNEIAEIALWLISPEASFVTGAHINAGGGGFHVAKS